MKPLSTQAFVTRRWPLVIGLAERHRKQAAHGLRTTRSFSPGRRGGPRTSLDAKGVKSLARVETRGLRGATTLSSRHEQRRTRPSRRRRRTGAADLGERILSLLQHLSAGLLCSWIRERGRKMPVLPA